MKDSKWNEAKGHFALQKALFEVFILPTIHFEQILNDNSCGFK
jgi:hypothetical protein